MPDRSRTLPVLFPMLALLVLAGAAVADIEPDPRVAAAFAAQPAATLPVWVHFADRDLAGPSLAAALAREERALPAGAADRRRRSRRPAVAVDDLPVAARHLDRAAATGARLRHASRWLNAASFDATWPQVRRLLALPEVRRVSLVARGRRPEPVELVPLDPPAAADKTADTDYGYNLAAMVQANVVAAHAAGLTGDGVVVGLLDTGFRTTHEAFTGLPVLAAWDFVNGDPDVADEGGDPPGAQNHGTMVLSTLAARRAGHLLGPAPGVAVVLAKTEDISQEIPLEEDHWVAGLEWAEALGADIVTSSLGYYDWYTYADLDGATAVTTLAADAAVARGVVVVNSAGNNRNTTGTLIAPADGFGVIAVGAVNEYDATASFTSPGPTFDGRIKPDVAARGVLNPVANPNDAFTYARASGTSFAAPLVAGVAALVLERVPGLGPAQVAEALRMTASQAAAPDNDQGWGIVDAWAAATWWGPVFTHTPRPDSEDTDGPYAVAMFLTARTGLDDPSLRLVWRAGDGPWQETALMPTGGGPVSWFGQIPGQPAGTEIAYYLTGTDLTGVTVNEPLRAPAEVNRFRVGPDTTAPALVHAPLIDQNLYRWPPQVRCTATDNLGLATVELRYRVNGGPSVGPHALVPGEGDVWTLSFPLAADAVAVGDVVTYSLTARDQAAAANTTATGDHAFAVVAPAARDTVLSDSAGAAIPDGGSGGLVRLLEIDAAAAGPVLAVAVGIDITHPAPEQLEVVLHAPDGTAVTLHDHAGDGSADLVGTWPTTLTVTGPGSLDDFVAGEAAGSWALWIGDTTAGEVGTLNAWSLQLTLTPRPSAAGDAAAPRLVRFLTGAPNPFNPRTTLRFELTQPARTRLSVFDVRGMLVRRLLERDLAAGAHAVVWDGRDEGGRAAASGVYLVRLRAGTAIHERKLTLVR